ncbi:QueT transporter family protein [Bulleidia extructa]|uniref:QueT transporter family protein n=1 Tax=Bulleidia extructa TaxID=118748 RepID=UPI003BF35A3D
MNTKTLTRIAMIAAVYTVVSLVLTPFTYGSVQVRIAEALTMLPLIYAPSIWGVTLGCFLTNLIGAMMTTNPTGFLDAIIGTLATFLAAYGTYYFREKKLKNIPLLSILCPIVLNFIFVGAELAYLFNPENLMVGFLIQGTSVAIGEAISVILGYVLMEPMKKLIQ